MIALFEAHFTQSHELMRTMYEQRTNVIDREFWELRELWWEFDPLGLTAHRGMIEDEYDSYVISSYVSLRDGGDLRSVVLDALVKMAREKRVSDAQIEDLCRKLRVWWAAQSSS